MGKLHGKTKEFLDYFQNLKLSSKCSDLRTELTMLVTNKDIFSEILTEQLIPDAMGVPYHLHPDDPEQIAVIKKLSNILYNVETLLSELEQIELTDEMYTLELAVHAPQIFKNTCKAINQIYEAVQLINNSSTTIQNVMAPQMKGLQEGCSHLNERLSAFTVNGLLEKADSSLGPLGELAGDTVNRLPTERRSAEDVNFFDVTKVIFNLPGYINQLQDIIKNESLFPARQTFEAPEDYQRRVEKKAKSLSASLEQATTKTGINQSLEFFSIAKKLNDFSVDLINTSAQGTKEAYVKSQEKLNSFKHELMPTIISEIESLEESLGLKSGTLTKPALESIKDYYEQLLSVTETVHSTAESFDYAGKAVDRWYLNAFRDRTKNLDTGEDLIIDPDLNTFMDDTFIEKRRELQTKRLVDAKLQMHENEQSLIAATAFFSKIDSINTFYNDGQFSSVSIEDKQELAHLYKQFQSHMAANNPELDARIVGFLNLTSAEQEQFKQGKQESYSIFQSLWGGLATTGRYGMLVAQKMASGSAASTIALQENEMALVLDVSNKITKSIRKEIATERQRITLIEATQTQAELSTKDQKDKNTALEINAPVPKFYKFKYNPETSAAETYKESLLYENNLTSIDQAQKAFTEFIQRLDAIPDKESQLVSLNQEEKEELKVLYKQFQPYVCHLGTTDEVIQTLNSRIVTSLMSDKQPEQMGFELPVSQLLDTQGVLNGHFDQLKLSINRENERCLAAENNARKQPLSLVTLTPIGITAKNTLLSQLSNFKLSEKIHGHLKETIIPYLKKNLSEEVIRELNLDGDLSKLKPYPESNQDASQVSLYKNMINSFLQLELALKEFESKGGHEYTDKTLSQALFIGSTGLSVGFAIKKLIKAASEVQSNPQTQALLAQGMDIVSPLKRIPGLASFFEIDQTDVIKDITDKLEVSLLNVIKNTKPELLNQEFLKLKNDFLDTQSSALGEAEVALKLKKGLLSELVEEMFTAVEESIKKESANLNPLLDEETHSEGAQEKNSPTSISVSAFSQLRKKIQHSIKPEDEKVEQTKIIEQTIHDLQVSLLHLVKSTEPLYLQQQYKEIKKEFLKNNSKKLSTAEKTLGLERGSINKQIKAIFDGAEIKIGKELSDLQDLFGGSTHPEWDHLSSLYTRLGDAFYQEPLDKEEIASVYKDLHVFVYKDFSRDFIESITDPADLKDAVEQLLATELIFNPLGAVGELQDAFYYNDLDFSVESNQLMIKKNYALLQPYLEKINPDYYTSSLGEHLKKPADYEKLLSSIAKDDNKKLVQQINWQKNNAVYAVLLSETHELRNLIKETLKQVAKVSQQQKEQLKQATEAKEPVTGLVETPQLHPSEQQPAVPQESAPPKDQPPALAQIIEVLYDLQLQANKLNATSNSAQLIQDKNNLQEAIQAVSTTYTRLGSYFNEEHLTSFLKSINELQRAFHNSGAGSHQLIIENLKNIRAEFGLSIIKQTDEAEFNLGLKPGTLSAAVSERFDVFYKGLLDQLVQTSDQKDLELLIDTSPTEKRLELEKERLAALLAVVPENINSVEAKTLTIKINLATARVDYLTTLLENEKHIATPQKIEHFKQQKFEQYVKGYLKKSLGIYGDAFFKELQPSLEILQKELLKDIKISDNIEEKIASSSLNTQLGQILSQISSTEPSANAKDEKLKQSYKQFLAANQTHSNIKGVKESFEAKMKNNLLLNLIVKEIEKFENKLVQFSQEYDGGEDLQEHVAMVEEFKKELANYKMFAEKSHMDKYSDFIIERNLLINAKNPIEKQKLEFMGFYEEHIINLAKYYEPNLLKEEIDSYYNVLDDFSRLVQISVLSEKLAKALPVLDPTADPSKPEVRELKQKHAFVNKLNELILERYASPKGKLNEIAKHLDTMEKPKKTVFNKIEEFFTNMMQKIKGILNPKSEEEKNQSTMDKFNKYKQKLHKLLPKEEIQEELKEQIEIAPSTHNNSRVG